MTILDIPMLSRIRRNHGLEHATINILSVRFPYLRLAGYSFPGGFFILGEVPTADLREAVAQALSRMANGERTLAIHEHCGTNYVASGFVVGFLTWLGMAGAKSNRDKVERLPLVISLATWLHLQPAAGACHPAACHHFWRPARAVHRGCFSNPIWKAFTPSRGDPGLTLWVAPRPRG